MNSPSFAPDVAEAILSLAALTLSAQRLSVEAAAWTLHWPTEPPDAEPPDADPPQAFRSLRAPLTITGDAATIHATLPAEGDADRQQAHLAAVAGHVERLFAAGLDAAAGGQFQALLENAPLAVYALSLEGLVKHWNRAAETTFGWPKDQVLNLPVPDRAVHDAFQALREGLDRGEAPERVVTTRRGQQDVQLALLANPVHDAGGVLRGLVGTARSLTDDARLQSAQSQLHLLESVLAHANDAVLITEAEPIDLPGPRILYANAAFTRTTGYSLAEVLGQTPRMLQGPRTDRATLDVIRAALQAWQPVEVEVLNQRKDGSEFWVELSIAPVANERGWFTHWISIQRDITERKRGARRLEQQRNEVLELAANGAPLQVVLDRLVGMLTHRPGRRAGITLQDGRLPALAAGEALAGERLPDTDPPPAAGPQRQQHGPTGSVWRQWVHAQEGGLLGAVHLRVPTDQLDAEDAAALEAMVGLTRLVIDRYGAQAALERHALHDALTGLPNRTLFDQRLGAALSEADRTRRRVLVGLMDLDRFKLVNDTLGHSVGDALLQQVAARLLALIGPGESMARMGGDEFLIISAPYQDPQAAALAARITAAFHTPFEVQGHEVFVRPSIGFSSYPDVADSAEQLLQQADRAMYIAKQKGSGVELFSTLNQQALTSVSLESALNHALARGEFVLHYQPVVDARTQSVVGAEALLRWAHPTLGLLPPGEFIGLAEATGLIVPIGAWVLREAARQCAEWTARVPQFRMSVNLSARQFQQPELMETITQATRAAQLPPRHLEVELTETLLMQASEVGETLQRLSDLGVGVSLDDFGTGYSNLAYLKRFPIRALKVDRSFLVDLGQGAHRNSREVALVRAVIALAHAMQLRVVAEGVEEDWQARLLMTFGCDELQGYWLGRPVPASKFWSTQVTADISG